MINFERKSVATASWMLVLIYYRLSLSSFFQGQVNSPLFTEPPSEQYSSINLIGKQKKKDKNANNNIRDLLPAGHLSSKS
jgi:hypothetical protein